MTKVTLPSIETLRKEESLRLHLALSTAKPGEEDYTKILAQITALNAHARAVELKTIEYNQDDVKHLHDVDLEDVKQANAATLEQQKAEAVRTQKQFELAGKLVTVALILVFEHSGHAIISKSFGLIRD
jgi:hypothetical protein